MSVSICLWCTYNKCWHWFRWSLDFLSKYQETDKSVWLLCCTDLLIKYEIWDVSMSSYCVEKSFTVTGIISWFIVYLNWNQTQDFNVFSIWYSMCTFLSLIILYMCYSTSWRGMLNDSFSSIMNCMLSTIDLLHSYHSRSYVIIRNIKKSQPYLVAITVSALHLSTAFIRSLKRVMMECFDFDFYNWQ